MSGSDDLLFAVIVNYTSFSFQPSYVKAKGVGVAFASETVDSDDEDDDEAAEFIPDLGKFNAPDDVVSLVLRFLGNIVAHTNAVAFLDDRVTLKHDPLVNLHLIITPPPSLYMANLKETLLEFISKVAITGDSIGEYLDKFIEDFSSSWAFDDNSILVHAEASLLALSVVSTDETSDPNLDLDPELRKVKELLRVISPTFLDLSVQYADETDHRTSKL